MDLNNVNIISCPRIGLTSSDVKTMLEEYYSGVSSTTLESKYNLKKGTMRYLRKKMKLPKYQNPKYSKETVKKAVEEHMNGKLMKDIEKEYGFNHGVVYSYMHKHDIEYKNEHGRKNFFNQSYFHNIDNEHKAYWLGFIYADGTITNTGSGNTKVNRMSINISNRDVELLHEICKDIEYKNPKIKVYTPCESTYGTSLMARVDFTSVKLCADLQSWGVRPNKTGTLSILPDIPEELIRHFIRGFFDGDGSVVGKPHCSFSIIGDAPFLIEIQKILMEECSLNKTKLYAYPHKSVDIFDLTYGGRLQLGRIFNYLYKDATIYLNRKYEVFKQALS